jgi:ABC-2 type transport system ATP-binding protein
LLTQRSISIAVPRPRSDRAADAIPTANSYESGCPLRLIGLRKRWRKDLPLVLDGLELALESGTTTWVGGRNGVGKTTMLRIAAGLIEPDSGRAETWGVAATENRTRFHQLVSFLPAGDRGLYARLTVRRQLEFWARIAMVSPDRCRETIEDAIERFELGALAEQRVDRMSMGQRQRLRIALTFLPEPEVVLLDEPLTSLDEDGARCLADAIQALLARDGAVLWCSPSIERLAVDFDACWTLEDGGLVRA